MALEGVIPPSWEHELNRLESLLEHGAEKYVHIYLFCPKRQLGALLDQAKGYLRIEAPPQHYDIGTDENKFHRTLIRSRKRLKTLPGERLMLVFDNFRNFVEQNSFYGPRGNSEGHLYAQHLAEPEPLRKWHRDVGKYLFCITPITYLKAPEELREFESRGICGTGQWITAVVRV